MRILYGFSNKTRRRSNIEKCFGLQLRKKYINIRFKSIEEAVPLVHECSQWTSHCKVSQFSSKICAE